MRVVDDHVEGLSLVDFFEASRDAVDGLDPADDRLFVDAERAGRGGGPERVLDVEATSQRELRVEPVGACVERNRLRQLRGKALAPVVADVHHRTLRLREQLPLRGKVVLHRPMEVQMLVRQVREDEHRETRAAEATLGRRV